MTQRDEQPDPTSMSYVDAVHELDAILAELDGDDLDVDALAGHVERAAALIRACRERIVGARVQVEKIVAELNDGEPVTESE